MRFFFDRRDEKNIIAIGHNEHNLTRISPLVRVNQNVSYTVSLNRSNDLFKGYPTPRLQSFILVRIPPEWLHRAIIPTCVPFVITQPLLSLCLTPAVTRRGPHHAFSPAFEPYQARGRVQRV